jgi:hypothetical protein
MPLPQIPRKILLHRRSTKLIEQRRVLLDVYLSEILRRFQQEQSTIPDDLAHFLQIPTDKIDEPLSQVEQQQQQQQQDTIDKEMKYMLEHAPCISIADRCPWNHDRQGQCLLNK